MLAFDEAGLHIVYGPNEAGKSSALRGLKALLFGIEERTRDNFRHPNDKLRINGSLRTADGHEITFARRKGRKHRLLSPNGEILDEQVLVPFLQGVTADLFETLFGIDHQALVQGGQEILEQRGEVGQALFSAALGSHLLHVLLAQLEDEADALFRPRGSTQTINSALKSFAELKKKIRDHSLSSREWDEHHRILSRTTNELEKIQSELAENRVEVNRLQRIQRIQPKLARHRELLQELEVLGEVVILSDDFTNRHQQALKGLETAKAIAGQATPRIDGFNKQLEGLFINQELLDQAENIEDLYTRLGGHRKVQQELPRLEAERQQLLSEAESILTEVRPDLNLTDIEKLHPVLARRQAINELGNAKAVLSSHVEQTASSRHETETRLNIVRKERQAIPASGSLKALRVAIAAARKQGDMDAAIRSGKSELASLQLQCAADLSRLRLWDGVLDDLPGLGLPGRESISRFEEAYDELGNIIRRLEEKKEEAADSLRDASQKLDEIKRKGSVPTEKDLIDVRLERDRLWQLLRSQWIDGEGVSAEACHLEAHATLPDAFQGLLVDADELSDRLRREAERVHAAASLQAKQEGAQRQAAYISERLEASAVEMARLDTEWQALWAYCRVVPHTPREMRVWLDEMEKLRDRVTQLKLLSRQTGELENARKSHIQLLNQRLKELGKGGSTSAEIETVLLECEEVVQQLDESKRKLDSLDKEVKARAADLESLTAEHQLAKKALETWRMQWQKLIRSYGLPGDTSPSELDDFIEKVRALYEKKREAAALRIRIEALAEDAASYSNLVASIAATIDSELGDLPADEKVMRLNSLLVENRTRLIKRQQTTEQLEQAQQEMQDAKASIQTMTDRLDRLCIEAKCDHHHELSEAERRSTHYLRIKAAIDTIEKEILEIGEGATIAQLEAEAGGVDPDVLPARIKALSNKIEDELEPTRTELAETKGREEKELEIMDGSDHAAALADQAQAVLATIRTDAECYVRVKIAARVLRDQIERYRQENQGPLLKRASQHFAALTLGSFEGLITDFNEKDEPVLAGIRPDRERVYVEGMSSGTRDQLYLALRLASLEKYMESAEPMPFIVDDVLVDFDDMRSKAALDALATLAVKTQVILFTHHAQVIEMARQLRGSVQVHNL